MRVFPTHFNERFVKHIKNITVFWVPILGPIFPLWAAYSVCRLKGPGPNSPLCQEGAHGPIGIKELDYKISELIIIKLPNCSHVLLCRIL